MGGRKRKKADRSPGWRSRRAIKWFEDYLRIPEGKFVGGKLEVAEFMREDFRAIYDNPHGTHRASSRAGARMPMVSSTDFLRASERTTAIATLNRQRHLTPSCGGSTPTAERTVGPARTIIGELDTQTRN
jgi:hypothetical protein